MKIHEIKIKVTTEEIFKINVDASDLVAAQTQVAARLSSKSSIIFDSCLDKKSVIEIVGTNFAI